jgi:hypothetical protein
MYRLTKTILATILLQLVACFSGRGQSSTATLTDPNKTYQLDQRASVLIDSVGFFSFDQILGSAQQKRFLPSGKKSLTFGYLNKPIWIKITIANAAPGASWYLEIPAPYLEYVDFYQAKKDSGPNNPRDTTYPTQRGKFDTRGFCLN